VPFDELRVEFLDPGKKGNRKGNRFVIGGRDAAGRFVQCVTIDADCTVTVNGTLEVGRQIVMGPVQADPADARLRALLLGGWLQGMLAGHQGVVDCIKAFSETDFTKDLEKIDVPTLIMHGDDDQIVPIADSAMLSAKLVKGSTLKIYPGAPHGMCSTLKDQINGDLLQFFKT